MKTQYAKVFWKVEDVKAIKPDWTFKKCKEFLEENEEHIAECMSNEGAFVLEDRIRELEGN